MKVCVLGDSHAAALSLGLRMLDKERRDSIDVTFFASRRDGLKELAAEAGRLICMDTRIRQDIAYTSGGLTEIDPAQYDVFIVHALGLRYPYPALQGTFSRQFVSDWILAQWRRTNSFRLAAALQEISSAPVYVSPQPYLSDGDAEVRSMVGRAAALLTIEQVFERYSETDQVNAKLLFQPSETVVGGVLTAQRYSRGSIRLDVGDRISSEAHPETDCQHMNAKYGACVWHKFLAVSNG